MLKVSRRKFLKGAIGGAASFSTVNFLSPSLSQAQSGPGRNLIFVNVSGGLDGLGTYPFVEGVVSDYLMRGVGAVSARRPLLSFHAPGTVPPTGDPNDVALTSTALANAQSGLPNKVALNPAFATLLSTANNGVDVGDKIRILKGVGILEYLSGSHETMQKYLSMLSPAFESSDRRGWTARASDAASLPSFAFWGICNCGNLPYFNTSGVRPIVLNRFSSMEYTDRGSITSIGNSDGGDDNRYTRQLAIQLLDYPGSATTMEQSFAAGMRQVPATKQIVDQIETITTTGLYPDGGTDFDTNCKQVAQILKYKSVTSTLQNRPSIIYMERGGFDTHSEQVDIYNHTNGGLQRGLRDVSRNLASLIIDLQAANIWQDTAIILMSEFGRTVRQNSQQTSAGTDHAYGSNVMVIGGSVLPGVAGNDPLVSELTHQWNNNITPTIAFESPIGALIDWIGIDATQVLPTYNRSTAAALGIFA